MWIFSVNCDLKKKKVEIYKCKEKNKLMDVYNCSQKIENTCMTSKRKMAVLIFNHNLYLTNRFDISKRNVMKFLRYFWDLISMFDIWEKKIKNLAFDWFQEICRDCWSVPLGFIKIIDMTKKSHNGKYKCVLNKTVNAYRWPINILPFCLYKKDER